MRIGIGVITMGVRPIHRNIPGLCDPSALIRVQTDHQRIGPAATRNACLHYLYEQGCTHFFMFDDDCYPVMAGWESYFIEQHAATGIEFFGLPEAFKSQPIAWDGEVMRWHAIVGCFSSQTRRFMDVVGYYNTAYRRYGYEDHGRNHRAARSGLCGDPASYPSLLRAPSYIHSEDVYAEYPAPNLTAQEKADYVRANRAEWLREINSGQIYYPHAQGSP